MKVHFQKLTYRLHGEKGQDMNAIGNITMERGKTSVHLRVGKLVLTDEKDVSMERFALVTLFVTETPVENTG